jgi:plasmid stabilization system protein ParE
MLRLRILKPARQEVREAAAWYRADDQKIARAFVDEIDRVITYARRFPKAASAVERLEELEVRHFMTRVFPYFVISFDWESALVVLAVAHQRREQGYWHPRLAMVRG